MRLIYNLLVRLYGFIITLSSLKNHKAQQWVRGRKHWRQSLQQKMNGLGNSPAVWVHCASYGEFEQGRPVMEAIRAKHPNYKIVLSFFSPSGYEAFKDWRGADVICYLPLDTKSNAADFIDLVKPKTVIFIKYEFWVNFLFQLQKKSIPTFLVSAVFKPHHPFFKWYGSLFRQSLKTFTKLFVQDEASGKLLDAININNHEVCGDTRFDRVLAIKQNFTPLPFFEEACRNKKVIVAGSTWPGDEEILINSYKELSDNNLLLILVPHHVDQKSINNTVKKLNESGLEYALYSSQKTNSRQKVLVIDTMGLLSRIYHYADIAYVGGGFDSGIHNCLEPAAYFKPVLFYGGNDYHKYNEAVDMLRQGSAVNIANQKELTQAIVTFLTDKQRLSKVAGMLNDYFQKNAGTTDKVLALIKW